MMEPVWWIREIDWRISTGVIFFMQLLVWGVKEKRKPWAARVFLSFLILCGASWIMRYALETVIQGKWAVALGYSAYIMVLSLLSVECYLFCFDTSRDIAMYNMLIGLTVYRICWDALKLISAIPVNEEAGWTSGSPFQSLLSYLLYLFLSILCCRLYRHFVKQPVNFSLWHLTGLYWTVLLIQMLLEFTYQIFSVGEGEASALFFLTALLYCLVNFILLMMGAFLALFQQENVSMQNFIQSKQRYYEISREGILSLQIKCHDLKHQIARIRSAEGQRQFKEYLDRLADTIDEYNTVVDSGNKDLDVVLTEKNIICSINGVRFTYIVDGTLFSFLTELEIYALFGNIMDNALEGMERVRYPEKKFISLKAARRGDMVVLVVENYLEHELKFEDGLPVTTKEGAMHHGFGLRSIVAIAQEHGGTVSIETEEGIFRLTISMWMEPEKTKWD